MLGGREDRALHGSVPSEDRRDHQPSAPHAPVSRRGRPRVPAVRPRHGRWPSTARPEWCASPRCPSRATRACGRAARPAAARRPSPPSGADVVHAVGPAVLGVMGIAAARGLGLPIVASYHTDFPRYLPGYGLGFAERAIWPLIRAVHGAAHVNLCPSGFTRDELEEHGVRSVGIWRGGVDAELFHPRKRSLAMRLRLSGGRPDGAAAAVGRPALGGEEPRELRRDPRRRARAHSSPSSATGRRAHRARARPSRPTPREGRVHFAGFLRGEELAEAFASADLFVMPSKTETLGFVVLEAMAAGLPGRGRPRRRPSRSGPARGERAALPPGPAARGGAGDPAHARSTRDGAGCSRVSRARAPKARAGAPRRAASWAPTGAPSCSRASRAAPCGASARCSSLERCPVAAFRGAATRPVAARPRRDADGRPRAALLALMGYWGYVSGVHGSVAPLLATSFGLADAEVARALLVARRRLAARALRSAAPPIASDGDARCSLCAPRFPSRPRRARPQRARAATSRRSSPPSASAPRSSPR